MSVVFRALGLVFAAGCFGGLINSLVVYLFGVSGLTKALGVQMAPALTGSFLYPRIVWGGIWGLLFLLPFWRQAWFKRGLLVSLGPTLVQWLVIFPLQVNLGFFGLKSGLLTPALVILFNAIWGWSGALWIKWSR